MRTFALRGDPTRQAGNQGPAVGANPYIVSHGKNSQKGVRDAQFAGMFAAEPVGYGDNTMPGFNGRAGGDPSGKSRPGTVANPRPSLRSNGGARPMISGNNQGMSGWVGQNGAAVNRGIPASSSYPNQGASSNLNPMFGNRTRKAEEDKPVINISDEEFYDNNDPNKETIVEQNMYQILHDHRDCMKPKCLEVKPPIIKNSIYTKDFVPFPFEEPIKGDANSPGDPYKPVFPIDTDTTYGVAYGLRRMTILQRGSSLTSQRDRRL